MIRAALIVLASVALFAAAPKVKPKPEPYDPDKLPDYEVSCGRPTAKHDTPCECMKHRQALAEAEHSKCDRMPAKDQAKCHVLVNECPVVTDQDQAREGEDGTTMAPQCKRSCHKAKCECCHT